MSSNAQTPFTSYMPVGPAGVVSIPMNGDGMFTGRYFDPVYSSSYSLLMEWPEFSAVIEEINGACSSAYPLWQRLLPWGIMACGFVIFTMGSLWAVTASGFHGPSPLALCAVPFSGFLLLVAGVFGKVCCSSYGSATLMSKLRLKLSELNFRYEKKGIDLQLYESLHLEMYHGTRMNHHGLGTNARTVTHYTLVVQALGSSGQREIPLPENLYGQSLQMASAPPMKANSQP